MVATAGQVGMSGALGIQIIRGGVWVPDEIKALEKSFNPRSELGKFLRTILKYLPVEAAAELIDKVSSTVIIESSLAAIRHRWDERLGRYVDDDFGIVSRKVVTTAGVNFIVDAFQNSVEVENLKFHGMGTGNTAEANGDTALVTELTTEYNPNSTRATGTTTEGASANIYRTVGTNTIDSGTPAIVEHGIFSQAATGGGTLLDRSVFAAINLVGTNADGIQFTYELTCSAGG